MTNVFNNIEKTDYEIIHEVVNGNKDLYAVIIKRYQNFVFTIVERLISNKEDVKDIVQEIFIKIYFSLYKYDIKYEFKSWLYKVAINYVLDFIKSKNSKYKIIISIEDKNISQYCIEHPKIELDIELKEKLKKIGDIINRLKPKYREVIILRYIEELKVEEIAEILNVSCNNVKIRLHRAIKMVRNLLNRL
ncbi:MAG: RNA polymerase sigma factor [Endomicrobia bacterium]|nr:RNA polymerase sigma factor [Endomicrobiia bacterium]